MSDHASSFAEPNKFTSSLYETLKRHPKRIVFPDGEDLRILQVAQEMVRLKIGAPFLLGNSGKIRQIADENGIDLTFVRTIDPEKSADFGLFCGRFERIERYKGNEGVNAAAVLKNPLYFGAMMLQYGQADGLVAGNQTHPAGVFRPLLSLVKPNASVPHVFTTTVLVSDTLPNFGQDGVLFLADTNLNESPSVGELAAIAAETGALAHHLFGREIRIAMLSHSTHGSKGGAKVQKMQAATALAREKLSGLQYEVVGEVQADVALDPAAAAVKVPNLANRPSADVLVFPNLDAAHISMKLLSHVGGAQPYGQLILGLTRPAAQLPKTASLEMILGTAAAVGVEAIKYREVHGVDDFSY